MTKPVIQILLIEDNQPDVLLLQEVLCNDTLASYEFTISDRLETAFGILQQQEFDLILLDLGLPDSQGFETFEKVHKEFPATPLVVLSGLMDEGMALEAIQSGAQDYLVKGPAGWEAAPRAIRYAIERQQSQMALRESETQYRLLFENAPIGILSIDLQGQVTDVNAAALRTLGSPSAEATKSINLLTFPPLIESGISADFQACIANAQPISAERPYTTKWGKSIIVKYQLTPVLNPAGKIILVQAMMEDITERKRSEVALRDSETRYRSLFEDSAISLWEEDFSEVKKRLVELRQEGISDLPSYLSSHPEFVAECASLVRILDVNKATVELFEAEDKGDLIKNLSNFLTEDSYGDFARELAFIAEGSTRFGWEGTNRTMKGERLDVSLTWSVVPGHEDDLSRVIVSIADIRKRKQAEEALRESEERFRTLIEQSSEGITLIGEDGSILEWNQAMERITGISPEQAARLPVWELQLKLMPSERRSTHSAESIKVMFSNALQTGNLPQLGQRLEVEIQTVSGERKTVTQTIFTIKTARGFRIGSIVLDITERKQAEEAIRLSEKKFKALFEIAPVGISVLDREQNVIDANYSLQRITGFKKEDLLDGAHRQRGYLRPDGSVMPPEEFASVRALKESLPIFDVETGILTEDRGVVWTQVSAAPLDMPDASLVVITQDISERKQAEQVLRQRLAELETLHESGLLLGHLLEPKQIGQKIINVLAEKLDWYHTTIRLYHPESNSLELLAYNLTEKTTPKERHVMAERFRTLITRLGDGLSGWVLQHGETVRCGDVTRDPRYLEIVPGMRSGLYVPIKIDERTIGVISVESKKEDYFTAEDEHMTVTLAAQAAVALENFRLFKDLQKSNEGLSRAYDETIEGWSRALDLRDRETEGHTQRVTVLTIDLARAMGIPEADLVHVRRGALLHDIGKMGVPDQILLKQEELTAEEWEIMRQHPVHAYRLLSRIDFLRPALDIPRYHHERWDGSGYPEGLRGEQIPLTARIFAIVDVWDALTSDRPYRRAWPREQALTYIRERSGSQFDPRVVRAFLQAFAPE